MMDIGGGLCTHLSAAEYPWGFQSLKWLIKLSHDPAIVLSQYDFELCS